MSPAEEIAPLRAEVMRLQALVQQQTEQIALLRFGNQALVARWVFRTTPDTRCTCFLLPLAF